MTGAEKKPRPWSYQYAAAGLLRALGDYMAEESPNDLPTREEQIRDGFDGIFGDEPEEGAAYSEDAARDWLRRYMCSTSDEIAEVIRGIYAETEKHEYARRAEIRALEEVMSK